MNNEKCVDAIIDYNYVITVLYIHTISIVAYCGKQLKIFLHIISEILLQQHANEQT